MRKPVLTIDSVRAAIERAKQGKGRQLALLIKSCSTEDLARGLSRAGTYYEGTFEGGLFLCGLATALAHVEGRRAGRADVARILADARRGARGKRHGKEERP